MTEFDTFEKFWEEVKGYADEHLLSYTYVEEEFILDGEFIPIDLMYEKDYCFDFDLRDELD